jgi:hypothetical protein
VPGVTSRRAASIAAAFTAGQGRTVAAHAPARVRPQILHVFSATFVSGLNELLVIAGVVALVGALGALLLVRGSDFVVPQPR